MRLSENTVLITGGASGIGLAMAEAFLFHRSTVIVCGRNQAKLKDLADKHPDINTICCDVADEEQVIAMREKIASDFPGFNVLVNNAGIEQAIDFFEDSAILEKIDLEIDINFRAAVRLVGHFMPLLKQAPAATIINISSLQAVIPKKSAPVYCATKAALHAFSRSLRYQLEKRRIKVFEVIPPMVATDMRKDRKTVGKCISPKDLVREVFRGLERDDYEIHGGLSKMALSVNRYFPTLMQKIAKRR